jgi:hypothetical protein
VACGSSDALEDAIDGAGEWPQPNRCEPPTAAFCIHTQIAYDGGVEFVEAPTFTALVAEYLEDDDYRASQLFLASDPEAGDVIPGTGGFESCDGLIAAEARASVAASE